jgi:hypothetical protein
MPTLRLGLHAGRRGVFLVLFGAVYALIGYSYLTLSPVSAAPVRRSLRLALNLAPLTVYAWLWLGSGIVLVLSGLVSPGRKPVGFTVAVVMPTLWAVVYFAAWVAGDIPRGWVQSAIFAALAAAVAVVAGMPEPRDLLRGRR